MKLLKKTIPFFLLLSDFFLVLFSFAFGRSLVPDGSFSSSFVDLFVYALALSRLLWLYLFNSYDLLSTDLRMPYATRALIADLIFAILTVNVIMFSPLRYKGANFGRLAILSSLFFLTLSSYFLRLLLYAYFVEKGKILEKVYLVMPREIAQAIEQDFPYKGRQSHLELVHLNPSQKAPTDLAKEENAVIVFYELSKLPASWQKLLFELKTRGHVIYDLPSFYENYFQALPVLHLSRGWFLYNEGFHTLRSYFSLRLKRLSDVSLSLFFLTLTMPIMLISALLLFLADGWPIIFQQERTGQGGRTFTIYKFRTMRRDAEKEGPRWASIGDRRVHSLGRVLRLLRIDELPQLFNVLKGDMSFIGPRPERPEFDKKLEKKIPFYQLRYLMRPGITGWAQVNYPYGASEEDARRKLEYDLYYVKNFSFYLDLKILLRTFRTVLFARGR
ncbi:MAG: exopolysaccharide biosynthesis polyprenyl glycosylphosphotransferase [Leptospiraceae bacterium]|nr:exopolysaccharide biosynthesis polyprenyl glycosylphosphotransferase [Leptospiraceae bacterium]MDW8306174.1 exopolysaccharide biosynthesis polyprenyl glycosylphosphotransferase [Leptospiraceae bacterium]